ncbi:hypothetical protein JOQ06_024168 [Pogonophryne albipinna]|uniref:DUF4592 domain-containing protein n=1 Tax=Pogonophryne albipinna TaxID=1090488 RepID=A0AAD6FUK7_9TELE|nr:hypothetical protein JOQ06_024168 [Pogonophryne albipinna]
MAGKTPTKSVKIQSLFPQSWSGSSRAVSPLVVPGDFSQPASPFGCLDNSAAKHKLGLRHKACNRRKHVSRLELKSEGDAVLDGTLNASITAEEQDQENPAEGVRADELKPKEEREEEEEQPKHSRLSDEEEDECEAEQEVSHGPDTSSLTELRLPEEESPDISPLPSSGPGSRASSPDSPGATPEPPAGPKEYLLDPLSITFGAEEVDLSGEEDGIQENREEEESSFLQEVLSSLKTPLASCSLMTEGVDLEIKEEVKEREVVEMEGEEVAEEEEEEVVEPVGYQAAPVDSILSHQSSQEEVSTLSTASCQDVEQEESMEVKEEAALEEEELVVEEEP